MRYPGFLETKMHIYSTLKYIHTGFLETKMHIYSTLKYMVQPH